MRLTSTRRDAARRSAARRGAAQRPSGSCPKSGPPSWPVTRISRRGATASSATAGIPWYSAPSVRRIAPRRTAPRHTTLPTFPFPSAERRFTRSHKSTLSIDSAHYVFSIPPCQRPRVLSPRRCHRHRNCFYKETEYSVEIFASSHLRGNISSKLS